MAKPLLFGMVEIDIFLLRQNFNWEYRATKDRNLRAIYICINLNICANLSAQMCTQDHNISVQFRSMSNMYKYDNTRAQMGKRKGTESDGNAGLPQMSLSCTYVLDNIWSIWSPGLLLRSLETFKQTLCSIFPNWLCSNTSNRQSYCITNKSSALIAMFVHNFAHLLFFCSQMCRCIVYYTL